MKANEKNILIGMIVVALLLVGASYKFFYSSEIEKADAVQTEIDSYQARMNELNEKNTKRQMYEAGIANSQSVIDTILELYGPGNKPEKTLMMVVDLCKKTGCSISSISFRDDQLIYSNEAGQEGEEEQGTQIFKSGMAVTISSGYTQLKKIMDYINSYPERMNVDNFTTKFDGENGQLLTSMNVNFYSVKDKNHTYVDPIIEDIELGTDNIFKSSGVIAAEEEEGTEETEDGNTSVTVESNNGETGSAETSDDATNENNE